MSLFKAIQVPTLVVLAIAGPTSGSSAPDVLTAVDLDGRRVNLFSDDSKASVLLFVRTDCPLTNRYAPEMKRIALRFAGDHVQFWMVYPDRTESAETIRKHLETYGFPGGALRDRNRALEHSAKVSVTPEAAVFDGAGHLQYHGRIDDRWISFGKSRQEPTRHDLEVAISEVLEGRAVSLPETKAVGCYLADLQ